VVTDCDLKRDPAPETNSAIIVRLVSGGAPFRGPSGAIRHSFLDQLPESGAYVIALPMKIEGGSGRPLRIVAVLPD
jgi:hypothetical protein